MLCIFYNKKRAKNIAKPVLPGEQEEERLLEIDVSL